VQSRRLVDGCLRLPFAAQTSVNGAWWDIRNPGSRARSERGEALRQINTNLVALVSRQQAQMILLQCGQAFSLSGRITEKLAALAMAAEIRLRAKPP
jgi:hypothetical protein